MTKTHWKKLHNPDYLGAYALNPGEDLILTIDYLREEEITGNSGKKERGLVCHFKEKVKPMIFNVTNSKTVEKLFGSPYIEDWSGEKIQIYSATVAAFGDTVEALRVRPFKPNPEIQYKCADCQKVIESHGQFKPEDIALRSKASFGRVLCFKCAEKAKKNQEAQDGIEL